MTMDGFTLKLSVVPVAMVRAQIWSCKRVGDERVTYEWKWFLVWQGPIDCQSGDIGRVWDSITIGWRWWVELEEELPHA